MGWMISNLWFRIQQADSLERIAWLHFAPASSEHLRQHKEDAKIRTRYLWIQFNTLLHCQHTRLQWTSGLEMLQRKWISEFFYSRSWGFPPRPKGVLEEQQKCQKLICRSPSGGCMFSMARGDAAIFPWLTHKGQLPGNDYFYKSVYSPSTHGIRRREPEVTC